MAIEFLPMPPSEWHLYYKVCAAAFRPGIMSVMFPNGITEAGAQTSLAGMRRNNERYPGRTHIFKVVDTTLPETDPYGKIVGVSQWKIYPRERTEEEVAAEEHQSEEDENNFGLPEGMDKQVIEDFVGACSEYKKKHLGRKPYILLQVLATRPDQHRKGVGKVSMDWGCKKADELGLPAYLEGSPMGVGLYKRYGFEVVDELPWDARKYGYEDALTHLCMKRQPKQP